MYTGINVGAISVKITTIDVDGNILENQIINHQGQPYEVLKDLKTDSKFYGVSGYLGTISESQAIERLIQEKSSYFSAVISLGGESFLIYLLKENKIINVLSHNRCAAGSGEFLVQQIGRLNLSVEEAIERAKEGNPVKLASRCSVHCKSDITHKLNRQEASMEDILYSVHESMASKISSLLLRSKHDKERILVIGGLARNEVLIECIQNNLNESEIVVLSESVNFEALGTALLVRDNPKYTKPEITIERKYQTLPMLNEAEGLVKIIENSVINTDEIGENLVLGIDGGSTTTKVALLDPISKKIVSSHYTRTNGNPVDALKRCIKQVLDDVGEQKIELVATTGSAREILGAFVGTSAVYNEISAHATGALSYDEDVDTIFEIGGQDAKYIYIQNKSPVDYAMNAACSAGTGSFLEESAQGDLGVSVLEISDIAMNSDSPVKFNAECAAFINSDIRSALQEGFTKTDIVGGLVSSIVNNYLTKVKGPRRVGKKVFLQGGVAKNHAMAYAFAQATNKEIIVPPNPELMGAYGVALMALEKVENNPSLLRTYYLSDLLETEMNIIGNFTCRSCENYCTINRYKVGERKFPFGGLCSRYETQWKNTKKSIDVEDYVKRRNDLIFSPLEEKSEKEGIKIGIPRALTTHFLFPLYYTLLDELGFQVVLSGIDDDGENYVNAPFCFPTQVAHGAVLDLINDNSVDYIFFPQVQRMPYLQSKITSYLCPITQANPHLIRKSFPEAKLLVPDLNFQSGYSDLKVFNDIFVNEFSFSSKRVEDAYVKAVDAQLSVEKKMSELGLEVLEKAISSEEPAIILVGRSYNAFPNETSQSIGRKLASKGVLTIPFDCLGDQEFSDTAWYFSNLILQAVELTKKHDNLFILYISNFSCNVDNFTLEYLREEVGEKPFLKLDIDSHTADAGTLTRIEAFLEIIDNYRQSQSTSQKKKFIPTRVIKENDAYFVLTNNGEKLDLKDRSIKYHYPVFSKYHSETLPLVFNWMGYDSPKPVVLSLEQLNRGLQHTSGNECLPMPIYIGQLLEIYEQKKEGEIIAVFMIAGGAPCVVASYVDVLNKFIEKNELKDIFIFDPHQSFNNLYNMNKVDLFKHFPVGLLLGDIVLEIHNVLKVASNEDGIELFEKAWNKLLENSTTHQKFDENLPIFISKLKEIPLERDIADLPIIIVSGDFFVRFDPFFIQGLVDKYAEHGIIMKPVDLSELLLYGPHDDMMIFAENFERPLNSKIQLMKAFATCGGSNGRGYIRNWMYKTVLEKLESNMRKKFEQTGLLVSEQNQISSILDHASEHINLTITGEAVLTIGKAVEAFHKNYDGVMILGPFACLPYKISEGILKPLFQEKDFPFISYETDGRVVPPSFLRLVDVHIQQVKRQFYSKSNKNKFIVLNTLNSPNI